MNGTVDPLALPAVPPPAPASHPHRDRIVAVLFVLAVALPGLALVNTWSKAITTFENRAMAPWPAFARTRAFTHAFELAFADRFGARDTLVRLHRVAMLRGFGISGLATVLPGRDGWYYWLGEDARSLDRHYRRTLEFPQASVDATINELNRRAEWLAARGIPYVVMIVPEKFTIYPEYLPIWVRAGDGPTPYDRIAAGIKQAGRATFIDLRPALRAEKDQRRLYYKTDSHWNYNGAVIGYRELMRTVQQVLPRGALPTIAPAPLPPSVAGVDWYHGDLGQMLGVPGLVREDDVAPFAKVVADAGARCARRSKEKLDPAIYPPDQDRQVDTCGQPPGLPRAVVLCDSMAIPLIPLMSENFSRVVYNVGRRLHPAMIEHEKPDIVIDEMVERAVNLPGLAPM